MKKQSLRSSRNYMERHRAYSRTCRVYKITPNKWAKVTRKRSWWQRVIDKVKSLVGKVA